MQSGRPSISLLRIKLQHKSPTTFTKVSERYNKNQYVCKQWKNGQAIINLLQTELQQKSQTISTKVTSDYNKK
jgi:hypothetical protein